MIRTLTIAAVVLVGVLCASCSPQLLENPRPPSVDAGSDCCVGQGDTVTLRAVGSGGGVLTYRWYLSSKPEAAGDVEIQNADERVATAGPLDTQGQDKFRVVATDPNLRSRQSFVTVTVGAPGASGDFCVAADGPENLNVGDEGTFTATASRTGELEYAWSALQKDEDGEEIPTDSVTLGTPGAAETTATFTSTGTFVLRVDVEDPETGEVGTGRTEVSVSGLEDLTVSIDGPTSAVLDQGFDLTAVTTNGVGDITYAWSVQTGEADLEGSDQATVTVTPTSGGTLQLRVHVTDTANDRTAQATRAVTVEIPTTVEVTGTASSPVLRVGEEVTLTASFEGEFDSVTYDWEMVDGPGTIADPVAAETTLTATAAGTIHIELTVRTEDEHGPRVGTADVFVASYEAPEGTRPRVVIDVEEFGEITLALEVEAAPKTVANFLRYVDEGFYEGVLFHRVVADFVIQGGGFIPDPDDADEIIEIDAELIRDPVESEAPNGLSNIRTTVAMALRGQDANSGTTQFFVNLDDNSNLDEGPPPFTVFAEVVDGMDVVDDIADVETGTRSGLEGVPVENVVIGEVRRVPGSRITPE